MRKNAGKKSLSPENEWMYSRMKNAYALHEILTDKKGRPVDYVFVRVNKAFENMTGLKAADITEKAVTEVLPGIRKDKSRWIERYGAIALKGGDMTFESYAEALGRWYSVYAYSPMKGFFVTVFTDISRAKKEASKAKEAELITKKYLDIAGGIIVVINMDGKVRYANKKCADILKMPLGRLQGIDWIGRAVPEQHRNKFRHELKQTAKTGIVPFPRNEAIVLDSKGIQHTISWSHEVIKDDKGRPEAVISYGEEMTALRRAESIIQRQAEYEKLRARMWKIAAGDAFSEKKIIRELLDNCGPAIGADRLGYNVVEKGNFVCVQEWVLKGVSPTIGTSLPYGLVKSFVKGRKVSRINLEKAEAMVPAGIKGAAYRQLLKIYVKTLGLKTVMFMPLYTDEGLKGVITADLTVKKGGKETFGKDEEKLLSEITTIVATVLQKRKSEDKVRCSEERFRMLFESAPDAHYLNDLRGRFIDGNSAAEKLLGYRKEELISRDFRNARLLPLNYLPAALRGLAANVAGKKTGPEEFQLIKKDGSMADVEITTNPVEINGKKMVLGTARDISGRKRVEKELTENEERYRAVFDSTKEMFFIAELVKGRMPDKIIKANRSAIRILRFSEKELQGMSFSGLDSKGGAGIDQAQIMRDMLTKGYSVFERQLISKNGVLIPVEITAKAVKLSGKQAAFISARDLTAQIAAEQQVRDSLMKYRGLFDALSDAVFLYRAVGSCSLIEVNETALKLTGYGREELISAGIEGIDAEKRWVKSSEIGDNTVFEAVITAKNRARVPCEINARKFVFKGEQVVIAIARDVTEKIAAKAKLELDAKILDTTTEAIFVHDLSGQIMYVNKAACEHLERERHELIEKTIMQIVAGPFDSELAAQRIGLIKKEKKLKFEALHITKSGVKKPVEIHAALSEINGMPLIISAVRDITERKKTKNELKKLFYAIEQGPGEVVITDVNGDIEYVNPKFCEVTGYSREEVEGKNPRILKSGEKTAADYKKLWDTVKAGNEWRGEFHNKRKDGTLYWESASISPITDDKGDITGFIAIKEDITEKKRIYEEMEQNRKLMSDFLENANDLIQIADIDGRFIYVNSAWKRTLGFDDGEIGKMTVFAVIHESKRQHFLGLFEEMKKGKYEGFIETVFVTKDGKEITAEGNVTCSHEDGKPVNVRVIFRDVTAKRETERRLKESYENLKRISILKSNFVSMVSHELRTPITSIKGFTKFLRRGVAGSVNEKQDEFLDAVENNTERLLNLINDLLDSAKIESGTFKIEKKEADAGEVLASSVEEMRPLAAKRQIEIALLIRGGMPLMMLDSYRINQVITNLINNAIKFSPENSRIEIWAEIEEAEKTKLPGHAGEIAFPSYRHLKIRVADSGAGIEREHLTKVFESYYQISGAGKPAFKGIGLGLGISKTIVEAHGGRIWAESQGPGEGSEFVFVIPVM